MINKRLRNKWISVYWYKFPCPKKKTEEMTPDKLNKSHFLSVFFKVKRSIVRLSRGLLLKMSHLVLELKSYNNIHEFCFLIKVCLDPFFSV